MRKILIIDDSSLSRNMLKRSLGEEYTFIEANDGMSGLEKYFLEKPDLVVLDLIMPGTNGMDILAQLKQLDPGARVIVGTADPQDLVKREAINLGAVDFVIKPFTVDNVRQVVARAINQS
jgi:two-component system chemotaxis response regulator CheY